MIYRLFLLETIKERDKMPIFRTEKVGDYAVIAKHHLKNKALSYKAKGLMTFMLSVPPEWDWSMAGLATLASDGIDGVRSGIRELEKHGYLTRRRIRDACGKLGDIEYTIHEMPQTPQGGEPGQSPDEPPQSNPAAPVSDLPILEKPILENPTLEKPTQVLPTLENPMQLSNNQSSINKSNTDLLNINQSIRAGPPRGREIDTIDVYREIIKGNIDYGILCEKHKSAADEIDALLELMVETVCSKRKAVRIGGEDKPVEAVKSRLLKLDFTHIEYVMECMGKNTTDVRNIKSYMLTALFNAPATIGSYYKSRVNHDLYGK
jgi:hypothetical protein